MLVLCLYTRESKRKCVTDSSIVLPAYLQSLSRIAIDLAVHTVLQYWVDSDIWHIKGLLWSSKSSKNLLEHHNNQELSVIIPSRHMRNLKVPSTQSYVALIVPLLDVLPLLCRKMCVLAFVLSLSYLQKQKRFSVPMSNLHWWHVYLNRILWHHKLWKPARFQYAPKKNVMLKLLRWNGTSQWGGRRLVPGSSTFEMEQYLHTHRYFIEGEGRYRL